HAVIPGPVACHCGAPSSKKLVHFVVMPFWQLPRDERFDIESSQKSKRPSARLILDVSHKVFGKEFRTGHLRQFKESSEQPRLSTRKQKAVVVRGTVMLSREIEQFIPGRRRRRDKVGSVM